MDICVIGDSHAAALAAGWKGTRGEPADTRLSFFAATGSHLGDLVPKAGALVPATRELKARLRKMSDGRVRIDAGFDAYILCGLGLRVQAMSGVYMRLRTGTQRAGGRTLVSRACYLASARACVARSLAVETLVKLRAITDAPALLIATPFQSENDMKEIDELIAPGEDRDIAAAFLDACRDAAREHAAGFLPQPAATLGRSPLTTGAAFGRGSETIYAGSGRDDSSHMNAQYGAIVLGAALAELAQNANPKWAISRANSAATRSREAGE
jgi:hypothetical protein